MNEMNQAINDAILALNASANYLKHLSSEDGKMTYLEELLARRNMEAAIKLGKAPDHLSLEPDEPDKKEMLEKLLDTVDDRVAESPRGGCYWCGFNPHKESCSYVEMRKYLLSQIEKLVCTPSNTSPEETHVLGGEG